MPRHDPKLTEFLYAEAERLWLRGFSYAQIGRGLGCSRSYAQFLTAPCRKLLAEGGYEPELADARARGFKGLPDEPKKPGGRPRVQLTTEEIEIREDWTEIGLGLAAIARKHDRKISFIRAALERTPNVMGLRKNNLPSPQT